MASPVLGIDLGTTNSVVCVAEGTNLRVLPDEEGREHLWTGLIDRVVVERDASGNAISAEVIDFKSDRVAGGELEESVAYYRPQLAGYRREVFDQFAETARKFKTLDESYSELHRQLASSASLLCGEAAGPLLAAPPRGAEITDQADSGPVRSGSGRPDPGLEPRVESAQEADVEPPIVVAEADETSGEKGTSVAENDAAADDSAEDERAAPRAREAG